MTNVQGQYFLSIKTGAGMPLVDFSSIMSLIIVQDINMLAPLFRMRLHDPQGLLTHLLPFDATSGAISIQFGRNTSGDTSNMMDFNIFRRKPQSEYSAASTYDVNGMLVIPGMFTPDYSRGWKQPVKTTLEALAAEMKISKTEISDSLKNENLILQPNWTNAILLKDLERRLVGSAGEGCFRIFIKVKDGNTYFVCKPLSELYGAQLAQKFIVADAPMQDNAPIYKYECHDNYRLFNTFAAKRQGYSYFNYSTGAFVETYKDYSKYNSLAEYLMIDSSDAETSITITDLGASNDFTSDFSGYVLNSYYTRLNGMSKMWIVTQGLESLCPGDIVRVMFPQGESKDMFAFQYAGYWMAEKIVHQFGQTYLTKVLLTRDGIDTNNTTSLIKSERRRRFR
jgi:hypothetical protein